jgi:hypothetical protein
MEWKTVFAVLFGGGISLVTSLAVLYVSNMISRRSYEKKEKEAEALRAFQGMHKLMQTANAILSLDRLIDKQFKNAHSDRIDITKADPSSIIKQIIGAPNMIEQLVVSEVVFLTKSDDQELISDVWEIQQRAMNYDHTVDEYNRRRNEYDSFLKTKAPKMSELTGTIVTYDPTGDDAKIELLKVGQLNNLIGQIINDIEEDKARIIKVCERFLEKAILEFGSDFPMKTIEWVEGVNHANP